MPDPTTGPRLPSFLGYAARIARKDLAIEWRSREVIFTTIFLAVVIVLVFAFAFVAQGAPPGPSATAGVVWVALVFSGTVGLSRAFDREREGDAMRALLLTPAPRAALYAGKVAATAAIMLGVEIVVVPLCGILFSAGVGTHGGRLAALLVLGTVGFSAVGCIFSAALARSRSRDTLLPALLYPIVVPVLIAGAKGTSQLLDPRTPDLDGVVFWTQFLAAVDLIFLVVGLWAFEPVATGD